MTKVINIYGASSTGKSTTAAMLYAYFKNKCVESEICKESVKAWAFEGRPITSMDQYYIAGKEIFHVERLINKVEVVICDCPIMQGIYYLHKMREDLNFDSLGPMDPMVFDFIIEAEKLGVKFYDFLVERNQPFQPVGRYQTESESKQDQVDIKRFLWQPARAKYLNLHYIPGDRDERLKKIINIVESD